MIDRLERASDPAEEAKRISIELIQAVRDIAGVSGVHVMAYRREHQVSEIVQRSGILERRRIAPAPSKVKPS